LEAMPCMLNFLACLLFSDVAGATDDNITVNSTVHPTVPNSGSLETVDILSIVPFTGSWRGGSTMMLVARIAESLINENQTVLPGYALSHHFFDDRCLAQTSQEVLLAEDAAVDTYVAFVGAGCDHVCESVSFVAEAVRLPFVSYECAGKDLSNTVEYPGVTRMGTMTLDAVGTVVGELSALYEWKHIVLLTGNPTVYATEITTLESNLADFVTTETYSVFDDSSTLMEDIVSKFDSINDDKERVLFVLADESLYRKMICASILAGDRPGYTWLSTGTWRYQWWKERDSLVEDNKLWLYEDADTDTIRDFFTLLKQAWDEYAETDELRLEGLQEAYITGLWDVLDSAEGPEYYHEVHATYHPTYRTLMINRNYYDIFLFDLDGNCIYSVFKETDFATNFRRGGGGEWSDSGLGDVFELALADPTGMHETPWEPYGPSAYADASFLGTGVFDEAGDLLAIFAIQLPPDTQSVELLYPECSREAIEDHFEGAINIAGLGRPLEQDMNEPLSCFPDHTAQTLHDLIQTHIEEGFPSGDTDSVLQYPYNSIIGNVVDGTCVIAFTLKHMLEQGYTLSELQTPTIQIYDEFQAYIRDQIDFNGLSGRVRFNGNDKPSVLGVDQVRELSDENPIVVGLLHLDGVFNFTAGGVVSDAWQPAFPDPPPAESTFPFLAVQVAVPASLICIPLTLAVASVRSVFSRIRDILVK